MITKEKIQLWIDLNSILKRVKPQEATARKEICVDIFDNKPNAKGTHRKTIDGYEIKAVGVINQSIDKEALAAIHDDLSDTAKRCIKYTPELINKELKELPEDDLLWELITEKPGMPSLEIKEVEG